jgi:putative aldouronate transport system substrate-binding protein
MAYADKLAENMVEPFPQVMATDEEQDILDVKEPDFNTFVRESLTKFITSVEPIENYDSFVETLYEIGLEDLQKVRQAQFERSGVK